MTIGFFGKERVDYLTYDTKGIWRCYEVKASLTDFRNNKAKLTFVGHFNYYVIPQELYEIVKDEIPSHIGVYTESYYCVKKAKKQELKVDEQILKDSMIRSLSREVDKNLRSKDSDAMDSLRKQLYQTKNQLNKYMKKYQEARFKLIKLKQGDEESWLF